MKPYGYIPRNHPHLWLPKAKVRKFVVCKILPNGGFSFLGHHKKKQSPPFAHLFRLGGFFVGIPATVALKMVLNLLSDEQTMTYG